jgi:hypothetical protein
MPGTAACRGAHDVQHHGQRQNAVEDEGDNRAEPGALAGQRLRQGHHQHDVHPGNRYEMHRKIREEFFSTNMTVMTR